MITDSRISRSRNKYLQHIENLGFVNFIRYLMHEKAGLPRAGEFKLYSKLVSSPLICRGSTSDIDVFKQIFALRVYDDIGKLPSDGLIIDCGANLGFSADYFLSAVPCAHVIAVEPIRVISECCSVIQ